MTRINVVPVSELSDQHLIAEYHELPRVLKQNINTSDAPNKYCLGKGHMKWAKRFAMSTALRYLDLLEEMKHRGFNTNWSSAGIVIHDTHSCYKTTADDIELNRQRLREKYQMKPDWYRWTNRTKPDWL